MLHVSVGRGGGCFSDEESSFLSGGMPHGGALVLMGGGFKKNCRIGGGCTPHAPPTIGNSVVYGYFYSFLFPFLEILKLPDNGGKRNVETFYFYDF